MAHRCHHGHLIQDSWMECPECYEEHDIREASYAAQDALIEARKQTKILEELSYQSERDTERESARSKLIEAQELARLAEERFRMNDLRGAVQLITQAIEIQPTFVSFYLQRAKYFAFQGKKAQAILDFHYSFETDKEVVVETEAQLKTGKLNEFSSLKPDLENLIRGFKNNAKDTAVQSKSQVEAEIKNMRSKFSEKPLPDFVEEVEREFREIVTLVENDLYFDLLNVPKLAEGTKNKATKVIARKNDAEKQARDFLLQAEQKFQAVFSKKVQEFASNEVQEVQNNLEGAKRLFQTNVFENYSRSIEFSKRAINATEVISRKIDAEKQAREFLLKAEQKLNAVSSSQAKEFVSSEIQAVKNIFNEAKQFYQANSLENYLRCVEYSKRVISDTQKAEETGQQILVKRQLEKTKKRQRVSILVAATILIVVVIGFIVKYLLERPQLQRLVGHSGPVSSVAFSPDGEILASAGGDNTVKLWNAQTGEMKQTFLHKGAVSVSLVAFLPDGMTLMSVSSNLNFDNSTISFWNVNTGELKKALTLDIHLGDNIAISRDGRVLVWAGDEGVRVYDTQTGRWKLRLRQEGYISSFAFSPDDKILATTTMNSPSIRCWDTESWVLKHTLLWPNDYNASKIHLYPVTFSHDGREILAACANNYTVNSWDIKTAQQLRVVGFKSIVGTAVFSPDGKIIAVESESHAILINNKSYDSRTFEHKGFKVDSENSTWFTSLAFSPDSRTLAISCGDGTIRLWRVKEQWKL